MRYIVTKNKYIFFFISLFIAGVFSQCTIVQHCPNKSAFLSNYDDLISEIDKANSKDSDENWVSRDKEVKSLLDLCYPKYEKELTLSEKIQVIKNTIIYGVHRDLDQLELEQFDLQVEMKKIGEEGRVEIEKIIREELGSNIDAVIDDVIEGINEIGNELKAWLKE